MARINKPIEKTRIGRAIKWLFGETHEGAPAAMINPESALRRSVMASLLWEDQFYESGEEISSRIAGLIPLVSPEAVAALAIEAREQMHLRHMPLFICREMARHERHRKLVAETLEQVIQRPDELAEFLAIYWKNGKQPLASQVKKGLAAAFQKFDEYQLAKYDRKAEVRLRDVLFLTHARPKDKIQAALWKRLAEGELKTPDTWEVELSASADKKASWTRLLKDDRLGALALIRNLNGMTRAGVETSLVSKALKAVKPERVLPFRFIAAARHAPQFEPELEAAMLRSLHSLRKFTGKTVLLIDVSGSMEEQLSARSELTRMDAASGLAILVRHLCQDPAIFTFSDDLVRVAARSGFALRDAIKNSQEHRGTYLGSAIKELHRSPEGTYDRLIVITDEQSAEEVEDPRCVKAYMINVASYNHGIGYGKWTHIDGWSEAVLDYIREYERPAGSTTVVRRKTAPRKQSVATRKPAQRKRPGPKTKARK